MSRWLRCAAVTATVLGIGSTPARAAGGQVLLEESFAGATTTLPLAALTNAPGLPCLTAGATAAGAPIPGCGPATADNPAIPAGEHALRLTDLRTNRAAGIALATSVPTFAGLDIAFDQYQWGGTGGDGISFALVDAAAPPTQLGQPGAALGYAPDGSQFGIHTGLPKAYLGVGLDAYGGFTSNQQNGTGCTDPPWADIFFHPNEITVRGPGDGGAGYCLLGSSLAAGPSDPLGPAGLQLSRSVRWPSQTRVRLLIDPTPGTGAPHGTYTVTILELGPDPQIVPVEALGGPLPATLPQRVGLVIAGSTGASADVHEVGNLVVKTLDAPAPTLTLDLAGTASAGTATFTATAGVAPTSPASSTAPVRVTASAALAAEPTGAGWDCSASTTTAVDCTSAATGLVPGATLSPITIPVSVAPGAQSVVLDATAVSAQAAAPVRASRTITVGDAGTRPVGRIVAAPVARAAAPLSPPLSQEPPSARVSPTGVTVETGVVVSCDPAGRPCAVTTTATAPAARRPGLAATGTLRLGRSSVRVRPGRTITPSLRIPRRALRPFAGRRLRVTLRVAVARRGARPAVRVVRLRFRAPARRATARAIAATRPLAEVCPGGVQLRREIRTLTPDDVTRFVNAVKALQTGPGPTAYDRLVKIHLDMSAQVHARASFFAWHRAYVRAFERALQQVDPQVTIPYWDTTLDAQAPERSPVFAILGGNGTGAEGNVTDGPFAGLDLYYPTGHILGRAFSGGDRISGFTGIEALSRIIATATDYDALRLAYEGVPHGTVHNGIGGDMAKMGSPNDPLFWLWHAQVDHVWALWQARHPASARSYGGTNADGTLALTTDTLSPFAETVGDVLDPATLCYGYEEIGEPPPVSPTPAPAIESSTVLIADRTVITPDDTVTLVATSNTSRGLGTISFLADGEPIAGCANAALKLAGGEWQAACAATRFRVTGVAQTLTARFVGAGSVAPSTSPGVALTVLDRAPTITFAIPRRALYGDPLGAVRLGATASAPGEFTYAAAPADGDAFAPVTADTVLPAGPYRLRATLASTGQAAVVPLQIDPAPLTVVAEDKTIATGEPDPELTWIGTGFVHGDTPSSLVQAPSCWIEQDGRAVGDHLIQCSGSVSPNYAVTYRTGTLTIRRQPCADGSACASDDPPTRAERQRLLASGFVCSLAIPSSDSSRLLAFRNLRPGVVATVWQASVT